MITKLGLRIPKLVVPTHPEDVLYMSCAGDCFIIFPYAFAWRLYILLVAAYLEEQDIAIEIRKQ
jgi:hypothetical protein